MNVEFTTTELITDEEILSAFGVHYDEGKFKVDSFIDCLENRADLTGLCITEKSKKELLQHLKELVIKLVSEYHLSWQLEEMAIYPLADFILKDDGAWEDFVDFFTSEKETASGTPYIDCYDIRELFENGDV